MANQLSGEAWHAEQRRRSQDLIRVYNPTDEDYILVWDNEKFIIPNKNKDKGWGKGMRVMQRYLARKFTKEMVDKILTEQNDKTLEERKVKLNAQGNEFPVYNANIQMQNLRTDIPSLREPLEDKIWLGIEEEFGVDSEFATIQEEYKAPSKDPFERLNQKRYTTDELQPETPIEEKPPLYIAKKDRKKPLSDLSEVAK